MTRRKQKKALLLLTQDEKYYFSSWLGDAFINVLQERYGKKEAEEKSELEIQFDTAQKKDSSFPTKIIWTLVICVSVGLICVLLYLQSDNGQGVQKLKELFTGIVSEIKSDSDTETKSDKILTKQTDYMPLQQAASQAESDEDLMLSVAVAGADHTPDLEPENSQEAPEQKILAENDEKAATIPDILPQYQSFHHDYPDLFGWLKIPGTSIDHPVMQSDDEQRGEKYYYLHRDYTGKQKEAGSLFVESSSSQFPQDKNTVIYGHNMSNGHNFGMLEKYKDSGFFKEHPVIQYDTIYETGTYQIVAVLITRILYQDEEGFRYYRFYNYHSREEFLECAEFINNNRLYDTGEDLQYGDQMIMLSTCEYSRQNGRLVVVAKKIG